MLALSLLVAPVVGLLAAGTPQKQAQAQLRKTPLTFPGGKKIMVEIADTPALREKGLMFRRKLPKDYGMLFVFPSEMGLQFWMKDTYVSLDIVFVGADKRVTRVHRRVRPSAKDTPEEKVARVGGLAQYVLELAAGAADREGLKEGQAFGFDVRMPPR